MFFVAGIGVAVFIEFLLISKKNKSTPDLILTMWMFLIIVHFFLLYVAVTGDAFSFPFLLGIEQPLPLLHGVFLYLYTSHLTRQLPENRKLLLLHFVPVAVMYLYLVSFFVLPAEQKIQVYRDRGAGYEVYGIIRHYAIWLSGVVYVIWSAVLLRRHRHNIRDTFSDLERVNLQWLHILTWGLGGIWVLVIFFRSEILVLAGIVVFVFLIGFFGVRQAGIFGSRELPAEENGENEEKKKYPKSGLTEEAAARLHQELTQLMTKDALYRKSDLSIDDLASKVGVHPNYLSQIINQIEKKNFYDFVNTFRIEEFKRQISMQKNQQYTLLSLAYDCGFSSKSSFNRYFKKATGQTPSEYASALPTSQNSPS
ncbi:MAG: helix-turn-helix transcriptional regulator [Bacteroidetes bacterium]|nr:helix-turn-helix transcriptional regulator [Bacteroidota bacterium]